MADHDDKVLGALFSVLPDPRAAADAMAATRALLDSAEGGTGALPWVEFGESGRLLRLAVTSLDTWATRVHLVADEHPDLAALVAARTEAAMTMGAIHLHPADPRKLLWFAPCASAIAAGDDRPQAAVRGLAISIDVFIRMMAGVAQRFGVTPAEQRTLFQLVAGIGPQRAAQLDGVSMETKRTQIKSLSSKLDCNGQTDLVRLAMNQLGALHQSAAVDLSSARVAEQFARKHLPPSIRLATHLLPNGRTLRTLECGSPSGRPVLMVHGVLFPLLLLNSHATLEALGIWLIVPLRGGYLEGKSSAVQRVLDRHRDQDDVSLFARRFGGPLTLIGHAVGAIWSLELASRHQTLASRLILLSPNFLSAENEQSRIEGFLDNLRFASRRPGMLHSVIAQFTAQFAARGLLRDTLVAACRDDQSDLAVIEGRLGAGPISEWLGDAMASSIDGVVDDMSTSMANWRRMAATINCPVTIAASSTDPMGRIGEWERDPVLAPLDFRRFAAAGHLTDASHSADIWNSVADLIS